MIDYSQTVVLVVSCYKYKQLWNPFYILFRKYWPDCPFNIYFLTDFGKHDDIQTIELGKDMGFSSNLIIGLNKILEKNIIYFQDDYLLQEPVDNNRIETLLEHFEHNNISCLRLAPCPGPTTTWPNLSELGIIQKGDSYRISTQTAIWKKEFLLSMLVPGETGANFEIFGTMRSNYINDTILSVWRGQTPTPYYMTAVTKGVWENGALDLLKKENIPMDGITKRIK